MRREARWSREIEEAASGHEEMKATITPLGEACRAEVRHININKTIKIIGGNGQTTGEVGGT